MARDTKALRTYRGDSDPIVFTLKDQATGTPIPLAGSTFKLTVDTLENPPDATTKVFELVGALSATPTDGTVTFTPTAANTGTVGSYFYDVQRTDAAGHVRTVVKSTWVVLQDITK